MAVRATPKAAWFSDFYYPQIAYADINLRSYLGSVHCPKPQKKNWGLRLGASFFLRFPKRTHITIFFPRLNHRHKTRLERLEKVKRPARREIVKSNDKPRPSWFDSDPVLGPASNHNIISGWLGKNSTMGKKSRLMEAFTFAQLSKSKGIPNPLDGIAPGVKSALTKAYKEGSKPRLVRAADLVTIPGMKKAPKKWIAALSEPTGDGPGEANGDALAESEEENDSDTKEGTTDSQKLQNLQSLNSKGIKVEVDLKGEGELQLQEDGGR